ncbi:MAG: DUF3267 domain-containing protein [Candidatus Faecousia sp.]|nr:DUF3267 domain-containing protein [Clostridiales bacterium]MDY6180264.1 DUF3267 domain-containing protein [Candidatus Faecousia sp.]
MKLHYKGKYDLNPESLPHGEHMPGAVPFKEAKDSRQLSIIANAASVVIMVLLAVPAWFRCREYLLTSPFQMMFGAIASMLILFPHEILHALCFKEDVYLYTNWKQGLLFVVGPETMSKGRFIFMSLFPNLVFGIIPYLLGMLLPNLVFAVVLGILATGMGAGDYYNVFNAATQMPKGSRTYLYQFSSYWYMPA